MVSSCQNDDLPKANFVLDAITVFSGDVSQEKANLIWQAPTGDLNPQNYILDWSPDGEKTFLETYENELNPFAYETLFDSKKAKTFYLIPQIKQQGDTFLAIALWDELCAGYTDEKALLEGPGAAWGKLIALGANAIMTDRPAELLAYLREKKLHD